MARLWATRKIGELLEQVRRTGANQEVIDAIVDLSLRYGIVTPYTSYLVEEPVQETVLSGQMSNTQLAMPRAIGESANAAVRDAAEVVMMRSASGFEAVAAAKTLDELRRATSVREDAAVRYVNGRTFQQQGVLTGPDGQTLTLWVDTQYGEEMTVETIQFGSDEYFALLKQPELAAWLALSPELVLVTGPDAAMRITTQEE
ncbi:MAG: hypothetical protein IPK16_26980 [Anaerolineales bacterium]|nr:hypothetical protein [Anaerolineales bacterium]